MKNGVHIGRQEKTFKYITNPLWTKLYIVQYVQHISINKFSGHQSKCNKIMVIAKYWGFQEIIEEKFILCYFLNRLNSLFQ